MFHVPEAGVCLSSFLVVRRGRAVLLGQPRATEAWPQRGGFPKARAKELEDQGAWLLPATHLMVEESPNRAALRIAREWTGLTGTPRFVEVQSHLRPARAWNPKRKGNHWDICFVYEMSARRPPKLKPWWSDLRFVPLSDIRQMNLGRGHADILEEAGYLPARQSRARRRG